MLKTDCASDSLWCPMPTLLSTSRPGYCVVVTVAKMLRSLRFPLVPSCPRSPVPDASCIPRWLTPLVRRLSVKCDFADSLLQGYFDGELTAAGAAEFERHLQHCVHCTVELVDLDLLSGRLQLAHLYEAAPAWLRKKIRADLRPVAPP